MAKDPSKWQDATKMADYATEISQAMTTTHIAAMSAKRLIHPGTVENCKNKTYEASFTRLFLAMEPTVGRSSFHVPSVVLGAVVGAAVVGAMASLALYRAKGSKTEVALMEEGIVEWGCCIAHAACWWSRRCHQVVCRDSSWSWASFAKSGWDNEGIYINIYIIYIYIYIFCPMYRYMYIYICI